MSKEQEYLDKLQKAFDEEGRILASYLEGEITYEEREKQLDKIRPLTQLNLRRAGQELSS